MPRKKKKKPAPVQDEEGWWDAKEKLPEEGDLVEAMVPWHSIHEAVFGTREDGKPIWYRVHGRAKSLPAVIKWKPVVEGA